MKGTPAKPSSNPSVKALEAYYHLPARVAAQQLGCGLTTFKKRCRLAGLEKWPYKKKAGGKPTGSSSSGTSLGGTPNSGSPSETHGQQAERSSEQGWRAAGRARGPQVQWQPPPTSQQQQQAAAYQHTALPTPGSSARDLGPPAPGLTGGPASQLGWAPGLGGAASTTMLHGQGPGLKLLQQSLPGLQVPNGGALQALLEDAAAALLSTDKGRAPQALMPTPSRGPWQPPQLPYPMAGQQQWPAAAASGWGMEQQWAHPSGLAEHVKDYGQQHLFARPGAPAGQLYTPAGVPPLQLPNRRALEQPAVTNATAEALLNYVQAQAPHSSMVASLLQALQVAEQLTRAAGGAPQQVPTPVVGRPQASAFTAFQATQQPGFRPHSPQSPTQQRQEQQEQQQAPPPGPTCGATKAALGPLASWTAAERGLAWQALQERWQVHPPGPGTSAGAAGLPPYDGPSAAQAAADPVAVGAAAALAGDVAVAAAAAAAIASEDRQRGVQSAWGAVSRDTDADASYAALLRQQAKAALERWMAGRAGQW